MNRETILKKAQNEKDERELALIVNANRLAGECTFGVIALSAILLMIDSRFLGNTRQFETMTVVAILIGIGCLYWLISDTYLLVKTGAKRKMLSVLFATLLTIWVVLHFIQALIG